MTFVFYETIFLFPYNKLYTVENIEDTNSTQMVPVNILLKFLLLFPMHILACICEQIRIMQLYSVFLCVQFR